MLFRRQPVIFDQNNCTVERANLTKPDSALRIFLSPRVGLDWFLHEFKTFKRATSDTYIGCGPLPPLLVVWVEPTVQTIAL